LRLWGEYRAGYTTMSATTSRSDEIEDRPQMVALAVVLQVRANRLAVLVWRRGRPPDEGRWSLPGGVLAHGESLETAIRRHLATKVDVRELAHLEQLDTRSDPDRYPGDWQLATAYLGLVPAHLDPEIPSDTAWHAVDALPAMAFDHQALVEAGRERLRAKLSYTNIGFAIAPPEFTISELRDLYAAALGHRVTATNLERVLVRRDVLVPLDRRRAAGTAGGRPAREFRFRMRALDVTDPFAVLRPGRAPEG
jgi:ADP-ribose pyrophosphatase YjhB (NUDIX family)